MTMSAALDSGLVFGVLVVFFGFKFSGIVDNFHWWGTEVYKQVSSVISEIETITDSPRVATGRHVPIYKFQKVDILVPHDGKYIARDTIMTATINDGRYN